MIDPGTHEAYKSWLTRWLRARNFKIHESKYYKLGDCWSKYYYIISQSGKTAGIYQQVQLKKQNNCQKNAAKLLLSNKKNGHQRALLFEVYRIGNPLSGGHSPCLWGLLLQLFSLWHLWGATEDSHRSDFGLGKSSKQKKHGWSLKNRMELNRLFTGKYICSWLSYCPRLQRNTIKLHPEVDDFPRFIWFTNKLNH